jgi:hypothetical protein
MALFLAYLPALILLPAIARPVGEQLLDYGALFDVAVYTTLAYVVAASLLGVLVSEHWGPAWVPNWLRATVLVVAVLNWLPHTIVAALWCFDLPEFYDAWVP